MLLRTLLVACILAAAPRLASAQSPSTLQALALPEGQPMICRAPDISPSAPPHLRSLVRREFVFAPSPASELPPGFPMLAPREVMVAWDSSGSPRMINDQAAQPLGDATTVLALFDANGLVAGRHIFMAVDSARVAAAVASGDPSRAVDPDLLTPPVTRDLTADEGTKARELAAWLWTRRCVGED